MQHQQLPRYASPASLLLHWEMCVWKPFPSSPAYCIRAMPFPQRRQPAGLGAAAPAHTDFIPQLSPLQLSALLHGQSLPVWLVYCRSHEPEAEPTPPGHPRAWTGIVSITKQRFTATSQRGCRGFSHTSMAKVIPLPQLHQPKVWHKGSCLPETSGRQKNQGRVGEMSKLPYSGMSNWWQCCEGFQQTAWCLYHLWLSVASSLAPAFSCKASLV